MSTTSGTVVVMDTTQRGAPASEARDEVAPRAVVLVEGLSDRLALEALARRRGRDLETEGVAVATMGGVMNIRAFLGRYGPRGLNVRLAGLYDAGEEAEVRRGLERAELGSELDRESRAPGLLRLPRRRPGGRADPGARRGRGGARARVTGRPGAVSTSSVSPRGRGRSAEEQLRRFLGTTAGEESETAPLLRRGAGPRPRSSSAGRRPVARRRDRPGTRSGRAADMLTPWRRSRSPRS